MFELDTILVKERVGLLKMSDTYDLYDASSGVAVGICKEHPTWWVHLLRLALDKKFLPTTVKVSSVSEVETWLEIQRGFTFLSPKVTVLDGSGKTLGFLKSKLFSWGINFRVLDAAEREIASVKGDWKGWNFELVSASGAHLGTITKKWAGLGKEMFTSADNYMIDLTGSSGNAGANRKMLLAAALAIDTCYKEGK